MSSLIKQLPFDKTYLAHEKDILTTWKTFEKYDMDNTPIRDTYIFLDGPPFLNSTPHIGHVSVSCIKDTVRRYWKQHGKTCTNRIGFDCHGLPIENSIMKQLGLNSKFDIEKYGVDKFNKFCEESQDGYTGTWETMFNMVGRLGNFKDCYKTKDVKYMETIWWIFNELNKKGLIYRGWKIMPYSYACESSLSASEASLSYKDVDCKTVYVSFKLKDSDKSFVAFTTTPWTLTSNMALCVNPDIKYVLVHGKYIVAENSVKNLHVGFEPTVEFYGLGKDLVGVEYEQLFNFLEFKYHKVIADNYVKDNTDDTGTGIVHLAAGFGEDDCRVCLENGIISNKELDKVCPIDSQGKFTNIVKDYEGILVFDADKKIIKDLKTRGLIVREQTINHRYPYCYRTDTPLIYKAASSFFIAVTKLRDDMVKLNKTINWSRKDIGEKIVEPWLLHAKDWSVSRYRYYGTPLPVWISDDEDEIVTVGSIDELMIIGNVKEENRPTNLHIEHIKHITIISKTTGKVLKLCGDIADCWLESAAAPYGQIHYPFENSTYFDDKEYLSDFVAEGKDQVHLWYAVLLVISTAISGKAPFKNVICTGMILDKDGQKISKRYGNYIDPAILINYYGADTLRLYVLKSPLANAEPLLFDIDPKLFDPTVTHKPKDTSDVHTVFQTLIPYVNGFKFFLEHYISSQQKHTGIKLTHYGKFNDETRTTFNIMDLWILEKVYKLRESVEHYMKKYQLDIPTKLLIEFFDDLTNWYIKFNRDRLKGLCGNDEWEKSLSTLYTVYKEYIIISAPFMPFLSEHLYSHLPGSYTGISVHGLSYPNVVRDYNTDVAFERLKKVAKLIRTIRGTSKLHASVKIPIKKCIVFHYEQSYLDDIKVLIDLIQEEVNCLEFDFVLISDDMTRYKLVSNSKAIGQKYKKDAHLIKTQLELVDQSILKAVYNREIDTLTVTINDSTEIELTRDYFDIMVILVADGGEQSTIIESESLMLNVDMTYDASIHDQFEVRKFIVFVQNYRKTHGFKPVNKISLQYTATETKSYVEYLFKTYEDIIEKKLGTKLIYVSSEDEVQKYTFENIEKKTFDIILNILKIS
jgi:isoleucyl-tRNA synthetase